MKRVLLILLAAGLARGYDCTSAQSGNWSSPSTWANCGGGVPGDGDFVSVGAGHTVTIDQDIGSVAGGGVKRIDINGTGAKLQVDGAGQRTVYFGSTGTDPIGSGSSDYPGSDATMFGFLVGKGTLDFSAATATNYVYLTTANGTSPLYIAHRQTTLGGNGGATIKLKYTVVDRAGIGSNTTFAGVTVEGHSSGQSTVDIDHCRFVSPYRALNLIGANFASVTFTYSTVTGSKHVVIYALSAPSIVVTDNTASNPASTWSFLYANVGLLTLNFSRNVVEGTASYNLRALEFNGAASGTLNWTIADNICVGYRPADSANYCMLLRGASGQSATLNRILAEGTYNGITYYGATDATDNMTINGFIGFQSPTVAAGQAIVYSTRGRYTVGRSIGVLETSHIDYRVFSGQGSAGTHTPTYRYNIARCNGGRGINVGLGNYPATGAVAHSNLVDNCYHGIADGASSNTWAADYGGAGAHHNNAYNAAYLDSGGTNFDNGTDQHPHAAYGDTAHDPKFVAPGRRLGGYDAWLGGPGTAANFVTEAGKRCGLSGAYNPRYNPVDAINWVRQGFRPRELALATSGWDGAGPTWAGPDPPVLMFGVINQ